MIDWAKGGEFSPMTRSFPLPTLGRRPLIAGLLLFVAIIAALLLARSPIAQVEGDRGIAAIAGSSDVEVSGIKVDARGDNAQDARENGWREAQKKAWAQLKGPSLPDNQISSLVSAVVIEHEQIGPRRYIATLGVIFDRSRAARYLGGEAQKSRSAPMLLVPVTISGGTELIYERRNPWQRAWAEFNPGNSRIDYVRPSGAGGDSLLMTFGQTTRRSRTWWRNVLDEFEAGDVLVPIARLTYQYPGGPVKGEFTARYGPDNSYLDSFTLEAANPGELPKMLNQAVRKFDGIFEAALAGGKLKPDSTLSVGLSGTDPALQRLIEIGRAVEARENAARAAAAAEARGEAPPVIEVPTATPTAAAVVNSYVVQFASPDAGSIDATLAAVRSTSGVRGAATSSLAIGGTSVMRVSYGGSLAELAAALRARGFNVNQGSNALAISR
ncbi:MAG: heavy-metal-associated domain-containing protein [Sphingomonadaceae bacterium]|nr:heavy-metal-associated domain-containing protein [Sphingomonadaceae bacterium]MCP5391457.1 heavy-metal-associated domain-containing protein [Sphingomonadaceae bacterium]MCP5394391.1 heavy-metal-associated domain-containing protein [Sphingomonadaceae bacterium]